MDSGGAPFYIILIIKLRFLIAEVNRLSRFSIFFVQKFHRHFVEMSVVAYGLFLSVATVFMANFGVWPIKPRW